MRLASLFTGGKDSTLALYKAILEGHEVVKLITIFPYSRESYMFHYPNLKFTQLQADAMGIEQVTGYTSGVKEAELEDLRKIINKLSDEVEGIVTGAIASIYQKSRIEKIAMENNLKVISPLWNRNPIHILNEVVNHGFEVIITSVSAAGLDKTWLGRKIEEGTIKELEKLWLSFGIHPCGEGGEYDTFVLNCPLFRERIKILESHVEWMGDSGFLIIDRASLGDA